MPAGPVFIAGALVMVFKAKAFGEVPVVLSTLSSVVYVCGASAGSTFAGLATAGLSQNLAPTPIPTAMNNRAIQPWKLNILVWTMPFPTVQPPASEAPTPRSEEHTSE